MRPDDLCLIKPVGEKSSCRIFVYRRLYIEAYSNTIYNEIEKFSWAFWSQCQLVSLGMILFKKRNTNFKNWIFLIQKLILLKQEINIDLYNIPILLFYWFLRINKIYFPASEHLIYPSIYQLFLDVYSNYVTLLHPA